MIFYKDRVTAFLQVLHAEVEIVAAPAVVAVEVWVAGICLRLAAVSFLGERVFPPDTVAVRKTVVPFGIGAGVVRDNSADESVAAAGERLFHNAIHGPASDAPCSRLSIPDAPAHGKWERRYSAPNRCDNAGSGTTALPRNATTSRRRRIGPRPSQEPRRHPYEAVRPRPEDPKSRSEGAEEFQY